MRRLILFVLALAITFWGRSILGSNHAPEVVALRDGLAVTLLGAVLFALAARPPVPVPGGADAAGRRALGARLAILGGTLGGIAGGGWLYAALLRGSDGLILAGPLLLWAVSVAAVLVGLAAPRQAPTAPAPAGVWSVESARRFLQSMLPGRAKEDDPFPLSRRGLLIGLTALVLLGVGLAWWTARAASACAPETCEFALASLDLLRRSSPRAYLLSDAPLYHLLLGLLFGLVGPSLGAVQVAGLAVGAATLIAFCCAVQGFTRGGSALLATFLLALAPWHVTLSQQFVPSSLLLLGLFAFLAAQPRPDAPRRELRWALAGLVGGLTLYAAPKPLTFFVWMWLILAPLWDRRRWPTFLLTLMLVTLPRLAAAVLERDMPGLAAGALLQETPHFLAALVEPRITLFALTGMLALFGLVYLLRFSRWSFGWPLLLAALLLAGPALAAPAGSLLAWSPLLGIMTLLAGVALDQILITLALVWKPVVRPVRILAASMALLLLLSVGVMPDVMASSGRTASPETAAQTAIGRYLAQRFQNSVDNGGDDPSLFLVPRDVLRAPATRLAAAGVLAFAKHVVPLDPTVHLPFTGPPFLAVEMTDLVYVIPADDLPLREAVRQVYPGVIPEPILDEAGAPVAAAYPVSLETATALQGLPALYFLGEEVGGLEEARLTRTEGPLHFVWGDAPPLEPPFTLLGQGALFAPEDGVYAFRAVQETGAAVRMELGDPALSQVLLDSREARLETEVELVQGLHPLRLVYTSAPQGGDLSVQWRRPGGKWEPIPRQALYSAPVDAGLLAVYYVRDEQDPPPDLSRLEETPILQRRREPVLMATPLLEQAGGVIWRAKLAAPVEGSYTFVVEAQGLFQVQVDGLPLLAGGAATGPAEMVAASMLLTRSWHDVEIRYRPGPAPAFSLRWEPPGVAMGPIPARYFAPLPAEASLAGRPLPAAPEAILPPGPSIAENRPSGPRPQPLQGPASGEPPQGLPPLPFTLVWTVGSCGADVEQFSQPRGAALRLDEGLAYIADAGNRRVILRDLADGSLVDLYTDPAFQEPFDLDVNILGELFLLDATAQTIHRLQEPSGLPAAVATETAFYRPRGLSVDISGVLYVADTGGARIVGLDVNGRVTGQYGGPDSPLGKGQPVDVLSLPNGALYAVTAEDGVLWRLDTGASQPATARANTFDGPHFAGLLNSTFFLSDPERRMVLYFNAQGQPVGQLTGENFVKPVGLAAARDGDDVLLLVVDSAACQASLWRAADALP